MMIYVVKFPALCPIANLENKSLHLFPLGRAALLYPHWVPVLVAPYGMLKLKWRYYTTRGMPYERPLIFRLIIRQVLQYSS